LVDKTPAELDPGTPSDTSVVHASENNISTDSKGHNERDISRLQGTAPLYSSSKTYNLNDLVTESGTVYRNITAITVPETFTPSKWVEVGGESNTASNVGTGVDVFLQKLGIDLEFRTLLANAEVLITQNALDLAFSIGEIAQSKITGLVTALGTKIDTIVNVGSGVGQVFRDKVGTTLNLKTLLAGTDITITNNADDITIAFSGTLVSSPSFLMQANDTETVTIGDRFLPLQGRLDDSGTEANTQNIFPNACTLRRMSWQISAQRDGITNIFLRVNGVSVNQTLAIPASTTGSFQDVSNTDSISNTDLVNYLINIGGASGSFTVVSNGVEVIT
jgi:hypothetical protein